MNSPRSLCHGLLRHRLPEFANGRVAGPFEFTLGEASFDQGFGHQTLGHFLAPVSWNSSKARLAKAVN